MKQKARAILSYNISTQLSNPRPNWVLVTEIMMSMSFFSEVSHIYCICQDYGVKRKASSPMQKQLKVKIISSLLGSQFFDEIGFVIVARSSV